MPLGLSGTSGVLDNSGAFIAGTAVASTSGTSIDFTSIPSWVKRVTVNLGGVSTNGSSNLLFQIGSGSVQTTGYLGSGTYQSTTVTFATFTTGVGVRNAIGATAVFHGSLVFVNLTGNTWVGSATFADTSGATNTSAGSVTLSGALDRVRITTVNGTDAFDAGTINILYE